MNSNNGNVVVIIWSHRGINVMVTIVAAIIMSEDIIHYGGTLSTIIFVFILILILYSYTAIH